MTQRFLRFFFTPLLFGLLGWTVGALHLPAAQAKPTMQVPSAALLKALFPQRKISPAQLQQFKSILIDLNGDKKEELIVVEDPNPRNKQKKKKACLCKAPKAKKREKQVARALTSSQRKALYKVQLITLKKRKRVRRRHIKIWWKTDKGQPSDPKAWMIAACKQLGRKRRSFRRWRLYNITFVQADNGQTTTIGWRYCQRFRRYRTRTAKRRWRRWARPDLPITIKTCPCPKKKNLAYLKPTQPLKVTVARILPAPKPAKDGGAAPPPKRRDGGLAIPSLNDGPSAENAPPPGGYRIMGRYRADNVQITPLTRTPQIYALHLERTKQANRNAARITVESFYVFDQGNGKMKKVFSLKTSKGNDPDDPGARQWVDLQVRNMDADHWLEIVADIYYENIQFSGLVARRMFKWHNGKFVALNSYRNIARVRASSTWKRLAPRASRRLLQQLRQRANAVNVVDGFRNTVWVGGKKKRSINDWVRIEWTRRVPLFGVAVITSPTRQVNPVVRNLWRGQPPQLKPARFVRIQTVQGQMDAPLPEGGGIRLIRFPQKIMTRYLRFQLLNQYTDPKTKKRQSLIIPDKERSRGFVAEIIPLVNEVRYTASSFEDRPGTQRIPSYAGDRRGNTAWAEGRTDSGLGEWLQMILPTPQTLQQITVVNGCRNLGEKYILNHRVKGARLTFSDGSSQEVVLKDTHKSQVVKFRSVRTRSVRLTITSIYKGKLGHTTCLTEMRP